MHERSQQSLSLANHQTRWADRNESPETRCSSLKSDLCYVMYDYADYLYQDVRLVKSFVHVEMLEL